jgi:hypothetical protein
MFSGLLFCADCGGKMYQYRGTHIEKRQEYFVCSTYRKERTTCTTHSICNVVLEEIVLRNLREAIQYVSKYEGEFIREASDTSMREYDKELVKNRKRLHRLKNELPSLI